MRGPPPQCGAPPCRARSWTGPEWVDPPAPGLGRCLSTGAEWVPGLRLRFAPASPGMTLEGRRGHEAVGCCGRPRCVGPLRVPPKKPHSRRVIPERPPSAAQAGVSGTHSAPPTAPVRIRRRLGPAAPAADGAEWIPGLRLRCAPAPPGITPRGGARPRNRRAAGVGSEARDHLWGSPGEAGQPPRHSGTPAERSGGGRIRNPFRDIDRARANPAAPGPARYLPTGAEWIPCLRLRCAPAPPGMTPRGNRDEAAAATPWAVDVRPSCA